MTTRAPAVPIMWMMLIKLNLNAQILKWMQVCTFAVLIAISKFWICTGQPAGNSVYIFHFGFLLSLSVHFPFSLFIHEFVLCGFTLFHFILLFHSHFSICSGQLGQKQEDYIFTLPTKATHCMNTIYPLCPSNHHHHHMYFTNKMRKNKQLSM